MKFVYLFLTIVLYFEELIAIENVTSPFILYSNVISEDETNMSRLFVDQLIFPGTKWCGQGNRARNDNDFGVLESLDRCCYNHDHCDFEAIEPDQTRHGLKNSTPFPKLSCTCDKTLFRCLRRARSPAANTVGKIYSMGNTKCYKLAYPIVKCNRYQYRYFMRRCVDYILDSSKPKEYQFFDTPFYSSLIDYDF